MARFAFPRDHLKTDQNPGALYFFGGYVDAPSKIQPIDFFQEVAREVKEELNIDSISIEKTFLLGIAYDPLFNHPEAFVISYTSLKADHIQRLWENAKDRHESEIIGFLPLSDFSKETIRKTSVMYFSKDLPVTWSYLTGRALYQQACKKGFTPELK